MPDGYRTQTEELLEDEFELCPRCGAKKMTPVSSADESLRVCLECGVVPQPGEGDVAAEQPEKERRPPCGGLSDRAALRGKRAARLRFRRDHSSDVDGGSTPRTSL